MATPEEPFAREWVDPNNPAVAARPSAEYRGGTVYYYADGTYRVVHGGNSISYRANSPGFDVAPQKKSETDAHYHARIEEEIKRYGAIGYTLSSGGDNPRDARGVLVFADAAAARAAYQKGSMKITPPCAPRERRRRCET